jgi:hypothetical protein
MASTSDAVFFHRRKLTQIKVAMPPRGIVSGIGWLRERIPRRAATVFTRWNRSDD